MEWETGGGQRGGGKLHLLASDAQSKHLHDRQVDRSREVVARLEALLARLGDRAQPLELCLLCGELSLCCDGSGLQLSLELSLARRPLRHCPLRLLLELRLQLIGSLLELISSRRTLALPLVLHQVLGELLTQRVELILRCAPAFVCEVGVSDTPLVERATPLGVAELGFERRLPLERRAVARVSQPLCGRLLLSVLPLKVSCCRLCRITFCSESHELVAPVTRHRLQLVDVPSCRVEPLLPLVDPHVRELAPLLACSLCRRLLALLDGLLAHVLHARLPCCCALSHLLASRIRLVGAAGSALQLALMLCVRALEQPPQPLVLLGERTIRDEGDVMLCARCEQLPMLEA
eukprot:4598689-Prymnesium_polylepis.2